MKLSSKSLNIKIGTILGFVSLFANIIIYIFYTPFLLKMVGDRQYGIYSFALGITTWFSFAISSMSVGYTRFNAIAKSKDSKYDNKVVNGYYLVIFFLFSLIVILAATVLIALMLTGVVRFEKYTANEQNIIMVMFIITILSLLPTLLFNVFSSNIYANGRFIWYRFATIFNVLLRTAISIPFLLAGYGITSVVIIQATVNVVLVLADVLYAYFGLKIRFSFKDLKEHKYLFKEIFVFTGALLINEIADKLNASIDSLILGSNGYAVEVAHYALGMRIAEYAAQAVLTVAKNFAPSINDNVVAGNHKENKRLFLKISKIQTAIMALFIGGFIVCGKDFIYLWLGGGYEDVYYICVVLMILYSYMATTIMTQDIERANNKHLGRSLIILGTCVLNASLTYVLISIMPREQVIFGCLLSTAIGIIVGCFIILSIYHKKSVDMPMGTYWKHILLTFLMMLPAIVVCLRVDLLLPFIAGSRSLSFLVKGFVFSIIFISINVLFFKDETKMIFNRIRTKLKKRSA